MAQCLEKAQTELKLNSTNPTTRVQIRLPTFNKTLVGIFNHTHTILNLREFIVR